MKQLMLGNAAVARGLYEAGCCVISSYPGTPSTEITEEAAKFDDIYCEWAPNEKVAMEVAFGASLAGKRSFCAMKHVGLNVAADPLFTVAYTGVNAGMVIAVADDPGMHSSQNEQDSRHYAIAAKLPIARVRVGLEVTGRGIVREHQDIYIGGRLAGKTTSGTHCPFLGKAMAMAYLAPEDAAAGTEVEVEVRGRRIPCKVVELPFYKR